MKHFFLSPEQLESLVPFDKNMGCIISDKVLVEGKPIRYLYRETPSEAFIDSGWRLFSGEETEEYTNDASHFNVVSLNTAANYSKDIVPLLEAPIGSAFEKIGEVFSSVQNIT